MLGSFRPDGRPCHIRASVDGSQNVTAISAADSIDQGSVKAAGDYEQRVNLKQFNLSIFIFCLNY